MLDVCGMALYSIHDGQVLFFYLGIERARIA